MGDAPAHGAPSLPAQLDALPAAVIFCRPDFTITFANGLAAEWLGRDADALVGLSLESLITPDDLGLVRVMLQQLAPGAVAAPVSCRTLRPDGSALATVSSVCGRYTDTGELDEIVFLTQTESGYSLVESCPDVVVRYDRELRHLYVNRRLRAETGLPPEAYIGRTPEEIGLEGRGFEQWQTALRGVFDSGEPTTIDFDFDGPEGPRIYEMRAFPERDATGRVATVVTFSRNVTEQRAAQQRLLQLASAVEHTPHMLMITDAEHRLVYVNPACEEATGYRSDEMLGRRPGELLSSGDADAEESRGALLAALGRGETWAGRLRNRRKDGHEYLADLTAAPIRTEAGEIVGYLALGRDVTEQEATEQQLSEAGLMESIGRLAGGVAHDFNNLLTSILGYTELVVAAIPHDHSAQEDLREIRSAAETAAAVTRQLLAFGRRQPMRLSRFDANDLVRRTIEMVYRLIGDAITLQLALDPSLPAIEADESQLQEVLLALLVNARDAMPDGGRLLVLTSLAPIAEHGLPGEPDLEPGSYVGLMLSDTGPGMDREIAERVFEPFFTTKPMGRGTGLGLASAYGLVRQNRAHIACDSTPGRGTTFTLHLPLADPPPAAAARGVILLVQEQNATRRLARRLLRRLGLRVLLAQSAEEAAHLASQLRPDVDLLLIDAALGADAIEAVQSTSGRPAHRQPDLVLLDWQGGAAPRPPGYDTIDLDADAPAARLAAEVRARLLR